MRSKKPEKPESRKNLHNLGKLLLTLFLTIFTICLRQLHLTLVKCCSYGKYNARKRNGQVCSSGWAKPCPSFLPKSLSA
jgi:hypothetical protein